MRIAMVGVRGIPARCGGAERVVEELTRQLVLRGHEVLVYCRRGLVADADARDEGNGCGNGHGLVRIFTPHWPGKHLEAFTHTASAVMDALRRRVDVVHVHSPGPALLSWLPALAGRPTVLTVHAPDWQREKWSAPARAVLRGGLWCGMHWADAVTAVSPSLAADLEKRFGRTVQYVPNAVAPARVVEVTRLPDWGLQPGRYALHVGRIVPEKRLDLLLECWQGPPGWKLAIAGQWQDSPYGRACRERACRNGLSSNVVFLGPQYGPALAELYTHAGAVVQPGVLEGMSLVLMEAASYGRCVVAADIAANREALGESALWAVPDDAASLTEQVRRCLADEELRRRMGEQARLRAASLPAWPAIAETMERVYRSVLRAEAV